MLRITSFCLVVLLSIGIIIPLANSAHGIRQNTQIGKNANHHSRAWWKRYRARLRRKRAAALARRQMLLGLPKSLPVGETASVTAPTNEAATEAMSANSAVASAHTVSNPTSNVASATSPAALKANAKKSVKTVNGQMNVAVVAMSRPNPAFLTSREEAKMLAGVNMSDLRRIVIDKMVVSGGWVTNDFVRDVNGSRVFVVTARTPRDSHSPEKAWTFYFTEVAGRIYGVTTDSSVAEADRMTSEAERFITNLRSNPLADKK